MIIAHRLSLKCAPPALSKTTEYGGAMPYRAASTTGRTDNNNDIKKTAVRAAAERRTTASAATVKKFLAVGAEPAAARVN